MGGRQPRRAAGGAGDRARQRAGDEPAVGERQVGRAVGPSVHEDRLAEIERPPDLAGVAEPVVGILLEAAEIVQARRSGTSRSGAVCSNVRGGAVRCAIHTAAGAPSGNGNRRLTSAYRTTPRAYRSQRWSTRRPLICSGAMYMGVPDHGAVPGHVRRVADLLDEPEVDDLDHVAVRTVGDEDIPELQVAVDQAEAVGLLERAAESGVRCE